MTPAAYGEQLRWQPAAPRFRLVHLIVVWVVGAICVWVAAALVSGVALGGVGAAFLVAGLIGILNAVIPPLLAALRLPFMLVVGFLLVLVADALIFQIAEAVIDQVRVDSFGDALLAALVIAAVAVPLEVILGTNDEDAYNIRVIQRVARRQGIK